ncbi:MAG: bifunctional diaminohydroxyphosphoribosylaminopyrimidine deaminase/5-amino-6-(5-phosphoribosylamino)uracil reductase RibD [Verrucomicrobiales bacterium]|nr:bifunctional diaminohydroxyphosphoribosylaminopyrimidine deaminase/5-amino-6-(5-phosphoribosylamino)uracil reductase RibD [Verrucomicrobiales bacterium]
MRRALALAAKGYGRVSPNPMVGAVLVRDGRNIGEGWHHGPGLPHAEVEAILDAVRRGHATRGSTLYVTLEPCCTHGRTPPCSWAIVRSGIRRVVVAATDPNPAHAGRAFPFLADAGIEVATGVLAQTAHRLNEVFDRWIATRMPFVTAKSAMTLDGKIATAGGESKWITSPAARAFGMRLRKGADAIVAGVQTVLMDDPSLTVRAAGDLPGRGVMTRQPTPLRVILDSKARTPTTARVVTDQQASRTRVVVTPRAPRHRVAALRRQVAVVVAPEDSNGRVDLVWLMRKLGSEGVAGVLVEGGGETLASFFRAGLVQRVAFFYALKILGGRGARRAVAGEGASTRKEVLTLQDIEWRRVGPDLFMTARVQG